MDWREALRKALRFGIWVTPSVISLLMDKFQEVYGSQFDRIEKKLDCWMGNVDPPHDLDSLSHAIQLESGGEYEAEDVRRVFAYLKDVLHEMDELERTAQCKVFCDTEAE